MRFFAIASILLAAVVSIVAGPVVQRDTPKSAAVVLTDLSNKVTPLAQQMLYATPENATHANLSPIIAEMSTSVTSAVSNLHLLAGQPTDVILGSVDGSSILDPSDIASLLSGVVNLVFQAIYAVFQVVDSGIYTIISDLCVLLGNIVITLISTLLSLVSGLLGPLLTLLGPILSIVSALGLTDLLGEILGGLL